MANEPTTMHTPPELTPATSNKVGHCRVCGGQWQIRSMQAPHDDAKACPWCGAGRGRHGAAVYIENESPTTWN